MNLPTVTIPHPTLPSPLPTDHQELMDVFYEHYQMLASKVRENNASLQEGCNEIFVNPSIEGMLRTPEQREIAAVMPPKVNAAVILGNQINRSPTAAGCSMMAMATRTASMRCGCSTRARRLSESMAPVRCSR